MKTFTGKVVSVGPKTAVVVVERIKTHAVYKKKIKRTKRYHVHDELGALIGQTVRFIESRPYSRTKKWKVIEILGSEKDREHNTK